MKFEDVLPALRKGKKIRRKAYPLDYYICLEGNVVKAFNRLTGEIKLMSGDLKADDWEIVKEPKKVKLRDLTYEQFEKWKEHNCKQLKCEKKCIFFSVNCGCGETKEEGIFGWVFNKDSYSKNFLDQEIDMEN